MGSSGVVDDLGPKFAPVIRRVLPSISLSLLSGHRPVSPGRVPGRRGVARAS